MTRRAGILAAALAGAVAALAVVGVLALAGVFDTETDYTPRAVAPDADDGWVHRLYARASPGVAFIQARIVERQTSPFGIPQQRQGIATGSGFVLDDDGYIVTNAHVVEHATDVVVRFKEGDAVRAEIVGADLSNDLALLKVDPHDTDLTPLPLGDSTKVEVGEPVAAIGNPFGLADTITSGIVSAKQRYIQAPNGFTIENVIQTDAAVNPGNSGGPLIDAEGRVIGINSQIATAPHGGGNGFIGIAFAIPINTAKDVVPDLKDNGRVERAYLGVTTITVTDQLAREFGLGAHAGALVVAVSNGSPADKAGLRGGATRAGAITGDGDVIIRVDDREIDSTEGLANTIADDEPGQTVKVEYLRDGDRRTASVRLARRPG